MPEKQGVPLSNFVPKERSSNISQPKIFLQVQEDLQGTVTTHKNSYSSIDKHTPMLLDGTRRSKRFILYMPNPFFVTFRIKLSPQELLGSHSFDTKNLKIFSMVLIIFSIVLITFLGRINKLYR